MKKQIALMLCVLLSLGCFTACGMQIAEELTFPEEISKTESAKPETSPQQNIALTDTPYEGTTLFGFPVVRFEVYDRQEADLDRCGSAETVALLQIFDDSDQASFALRVIKGDTVYDTPYLYSWGTDLWIEDLNSDGYLEIYTSGDMMSSDYCTYGWRLTENGLRSLSTDDNGILTYGRISSIKNNVVTIEEYQYVLGTWFATREFVSSDVRGIEPKHSTVWTIPDGEYTFYLKVIEPLPVSVNGSSVLLPVGSELTLTAYDGENTVWFQTTDGLEGLIRVQEMDGMIDGQYGMWSIDGKSEYHYFEMLPYAG